jgi:hypothetical protein
MLGEYGHYDPIAVMAKNRENFQRRALPSKSYTAARKALEDLKQNPDWIQGFKDRIPVEPNYSYGGPEY